jgi:hypothetical protein
MAGFYIHRNVTHDAKKQLIVYHSLKCKCDEYIHIDPKSCKVTINKQVQTHCICGIEYPIIEYKNCDRTITHEFKTTRNYGYTNEQYTIPEHVTIEYVIVSTPKLKYLGQCDKLRRDSSHWERWWKRLMKHKRPCSEDHFLKNVDMYKADILDDGETWEQYRDSTGDEIKYFSCNGVYFFQTCGFEFFWG